MDSFASSRKVLPHRYKARTRKLGEQGLGLAIVKHIMNRHRGRLQITSKGDGENVLQFISRLLVSKFLK